MLRWDHIIDSRPPSGEDDQGTFATLDNGDVTETGRMFNPATGNIELYVETWRRMDMVEGSQYCVLELVGQNDSQEIGYLGRVGQNDLGCGTDQNGDYIAWRSGKNGIVWNFGIEARSKLPALPRPLPEAWKEGEECDLGGRRFIIRRLGHT